MSALTRAQTYFVDEDECLALIGPVLVVVARNEPTADIARQAEVCQTALERKYRGKTGLLVVVRGDVRPPGDEARARIKDAMKVLERSTVAGAIAIEGSSFIATATRSAISMMMFVVRPSFPMKVFNAVDDAAAHLCSALGYADLTAPALMLAIRDLRASFDAGSLRGGYR
jgi:hypothetical protein